MGFQITSLDSDKKAYPGMIISYIVRPVLSIPMTWVTEITHVKEGQYFIDEQRIGPYRMWHHEHSIETFGTETKLIDLISYQPPFGFLGNLANELFIRKQLNEIFDYRAKTMGELFPIE